MILLKRENTPTVFILYDSALLSIKFKKKEKRDFKLIIITLHNFLFSLHSMIIFIAKKHAC